MKRFLFCVMLLLPVGLSAGDVSLVYKSAEDVTSGRPWLGTVTKEGVLISADQALEAKGQFLIGLQDGSLHEGALNRLDNNINAALIQKGKALTDAKLVAAHKKNVASFKAFLPEVSLPETTTSAKAEREGHPPLYEAEPGTLFLLKINGELFTGDTIELPVKRKKSGFKFEVVNVSTQPVWRVDVRLKSSPKLSFWKKGKKKGLNDVPRPTLNYGYQAMFKPLKPQKSFTLPVEVFFIKEESYELTVSLKSKIGLYIRKIPVKFVRS